MEIDNDTPISHLCTNLTRFTAPRADLREVVTYSTLDTNHLEEIAADFFEFGAWHHATIWPHLNGFQGYDTVRFEQEEIL